ncbi:lactonase family protein [Ferruginibacter albus]|uniref:lactonase family protein n=1 Tax=Ferruginibacter albus TaxID=2875540 RepID=UPI001CC5BBA1|nr:beta-propeller fold lactonase family protein [Ferruginibacter albus]UAY52845.1 beta-propeller fold lactonase family protein [Ferruginibacter albus]
MKRYLYAVAVVGLLLAACQKGSNPSNRNVDIVYLETNDNDNNAILAYYWNDTALVPLPGSPFATGGKGIANPTQVLGPDDNDQQVILTTDKKFLLAVNVGSNTISVFKISQYGTLTPVTGSPFDSHGDNPVSIGQKGKYIYVVNQSANVSKMTNPSNPNYTVFTLDNNGSLSHVANSTFETTAGVSPSQALVSTNGRFLFGADFLGFMNTPPVGTLRSFTISPTTGKLSPAAGTPQTIPDMGGALGLWQHPTNDVLYVGFPLAGKVGVYSINNTTGALSFETSIASGPAVCWLRTNKAGTRLYTLNSAENTVSVFNTSAAAAPAALQKLTLKNSGPLYMAMGLSFTTSETFSLSFSPSEKMLYVVSQYTNPTFGLGSYNLLHVLKVAADGTVSEPTEPLSLPVASTVRPQGVVVL